MLSCREVTRLVSEGLDRRLSLPQRISLWLHYRICKFCARYAAQVRFLREALRFQGAQEDPMPELGARLPDEARRRIRQALREHRS